MKTTLEWEEMFQGFYNIWRRKKYNIVEDVKKTLGNSFHNVADLVSDQSDH